MKINHIAVYVCDLEGARKFFEKYFYGISNQKYHNPTTGLMTYFLSFPTGDTRLELMSRPEVETAPFTPFRRGLTHLSFSVGSKDDVDSLTSRLADAGYKVLSGPRTTGDGYYESTVMGFEGLTLEITQ